jgi:ribosome-binding protein aMBF1 (putative translation factor)
MPRRDRDGEVLGMRPEEMRFCEACGRAVRGEPMIVGDGTGIERCRECAEADRPPVERRHWSEAEIREIVRQEMFGR